jgi:hypothetical protein
MPCMPGPARSIIDIAINHTGWAASLHETHPQWLARKESGEIENPGAWGVVWEDLTAWTTATKRCGPTWPRSF